MSDVQLLLDAIKLDDVQQTPEQMKLLKNVSSFDPTFKKLLVYGEAVGLTMEHNYDRNQQSNLWGFRRTIEDALKHYASNMVANNYTDALDLKVSDMSGYQLSLVLAQAAAGKKPSEPHVWLPEPESDYKFYSF
nr:hypothetical protein A6C57_01250 [Fibrella sp. ES10-3-2-2]